MNIGNSMDTTGKETNIQLLSTIAYLQDVSSLHINFFYTDPFAILSYLFHPHSK